MSRRQDEDELITSADGLTLFDCYGKTIYAYIRLYARSRDDAKDLPLEVFKAALEQDNLSSLPEKERLPWLRRVAHNKIVDTYRRTLRRPQISLDEIAETVLDDEGRSPEQLALQHEAHQQLYEAIKQLPLLQQQLLRLRYGDELPFAEIATLLDKREETVRKLLSRTVALLRTLFH